VSFWKKKIIDWLPDFLRKQLIDGKFIELIPELAERTTNCSVYSVFSTRPHYIYEFEEKGIEIHICMKRQNKLLIIKYYDEILFDKEERELHKQFVAEAL